MIVNGRFWVITEALRHTRDGLWMEPRRRVARHELSQIAPKLLSVSADNWNLQRKLHGERHTDIFEWTPEGSNLL